MAGATGGDAASTYPPKSFTEMRGFVERIGASDLDDLKQHCIAYYLLLDMSAAVLVSSHDVYVESDIDPTSLSKAAAKYAADKFIPCHFEYLMRGYWLMDHSQTVVGVSYLADPCVIADWAPKVLRTTVAAGYHLDAARFLNSATALMQPRLEELPSEAPVVMDVFLHCDFDKAFSFQRHISSFLELRQALLTQLFVFALSPCARRSTVDRLAMLPFDDTEEAALETYCLLPETAAHARDFLALHYVNRGRYAEAIRLFRAIAKTDDGQHLTAVQKRKRDERLAMAHNLILLLPAAQRWVIEELESINGETATTAGSEGSTHGSGSALALRQGLSSVPLSASKTARQLRPVVSTHGAAQSASHPLLRVLIKQMTVVKPVASDIELAPSSPCEAVGSDLPSAYLQTSDDDDDDDSSMSVSETQPETPKAKRDPASSTTAKSTWSTPMTSFPDRTLRSPASRSSAAFSPRANTANARSVTPLHSASTPRSSVQRVPFSGPPTTPRTDNVLDMFADMTPTVSGNWAAANQNAGNNILAKASAAVESLSPSPSHSLARRTSGGFVSASASAISTSRSPFAKARLMSINSNNSSDNNNNGSSSHRYSPIEEQLRDDGGTIVSTTAAHSMSLGLTDPNSDAKDSSGDVPAKGNRKKRGSKSRTKRPKPVSLYPAADDTVAACDSESITASSKASARNYERSVCQSAEAEAVAPKQSSRVRKRTVE
ncbi:hypothetical protein LPJ66_008353 [Kickxella alabastrina]|uniref:Uncharacterized protein n=1 Tax=Kickxella alabastrina TaxID=61397 RepID=A0ACC1IA48_9FUNG|nr:hypothetical protein LPJ66_008353 [Kickxella alabastrina]